MISQTAITGVIADRTGVSPGNSSQILYTIDANIPGSGVVRLNEQRPLDSYPDGIDVVARGIGRGVHGMIVGGGYPDGEIQWDFAELLAMNPCPGISPMSPLGAMMIDSSGNLVPQTTQPTGNNGAGSPTQGGSLAPGGGVGFQ